MIEHDKKQGKPEVHLPRSFRHIRLELAREPGHPEGSANEGYLIWAPLTEDGKIDPELWKQYRDYCRVVKFRPGQSDEIGHLRRSRNGAWAFHYDIAGEDPDEKGFHFEAERFVIGEYVSVQEKNRTHTYKVRSVEHY